MIHPVTEPGRNCPDASSIRKILAWLCHVPGHCCFASCLCDQPSKLPILGTWTKMTSQLATTASPGMQAPSNSRRVAAQYVTRTQQTFWNMKFDQWKVILPPTKFKENMALLTALPWLLAWHHELQAHLLAWRSSSLGPVYMWEGHFDGLVQDCSNSSVLAMELLQSCSKPSIC